MNINKNLLLFLSLLIFSFLLAGCGTEKEQISGSAEPVAEEKEVEEQQETEYGVIEIENNEQLLTFTEPPKRAVTLNQHVTEVMLALGLEEYMVGTAYLDDQVLPELQEAYDSIPVLSEKYPSQEVFLSVEPDFAYAGWKSAFREDNVGTVEQLLEFGINPYLHVSSSVVGPTIDDIYQDIQNIARIFGVKERGEELITSMKERIEEISSNIPTGIEKRRVFVYDSGETTPVTVGQNFLNSMITMAGGQNIFSDIDKNWGEVSWEEVVERNPEVIIIVDYGDTTVEEKKQLLVNHPALTDVEAIKNGDFIIMPLSAAAEGIRVPYALEILVEGLY